MELENLLFFFHNSKLFPLYNLFYKGKKYLKEWFKNLSNLLLKTFQINKNVTHEN